MHDENSVSDASCTELDRSKRIIETMKAVITSVESTDGVHKHRKHKKKKKRKKSKKDGSEVSPSVSAVREIETTLDQSLRFGDTSNGSPDSNEEQSNKLSTLWFHSPCLKKNTHNSDVKSESPIINAFDRMMRANSSKTPIESKRRSKDKKTKEIAVTEVKESKNLKESVSPLIQVNNKSPRSNEENQEAAVDLFEKLMQSQKNIQPVKPRSRGRPRKLNSTNKPKSNESIDEKPEKENLSINGRNRNTKEKKKDLTSNSKSKSKSTLKKNLNSSTSKEAVRESESNKTPLLLKRLRSDLVIADDENNISPSRPKRRCTQNVESYAIDLVSPDKLNNGKKVSISVEEKIKKNKEISPKNSIETVVIDILDDTPEKQDIKSKVNNKKLAPIFTAAERNEQKRQSMQARKDFLYSEISDSLKATINRQKSYEDNYLQCFTYPATSHVSQFTDIEVKELNELVNDAGNFNFKMADVKGVIQNFSDRMFCIGNFTSTAQIDTIDAPNSSPSRIKLVKYDKQTIRDIIKSLKMFCPTFPFTLCYNQLRGKNRLSPNKNTNVFTMKYRPRCTEEFIVNSTPVRELRKFLLTWQQDYINSEVDSDFEHGEGSNSSVSSMKQNNFIVLIGPPGSGKTIAVYALAEEMNFKILEMNSSERRKGQNLLQKLSEATKSHRVRTKAGKTKLIRSLFKNDSEEFDDQNSQDSNDEEIQKTIILMEDADIVMDEDEGFVNGIGQLIATSRRPIIMTTNSKNCAHLSKYVNRQCIEFNQPNTMRISCWLSTLSLVENTFILPNDFEQIFERNKKDIRKTLLELQIFTSTFGDHVIGDMSSPRGKGVLNKHNHKCFNKILTISNDMRPMCLVNNFDLTPKKIKMSLKRINVVSDDLCVYDMINGFNTTRKCDIFNEYNETISNLIRTKSIDDYTFNDSAETVTATETLRNNIYKDHLPSLNSLTHIQTEYEPVMRTICRAEKERASSERRSARFYHYLKPYNSDNDIFNTVCNYFIE